MRSDSVNRHDAWQARRFLGERMSAAALPKLIVTCRNCGRDCLTVWVPGWTIAQIEAAETLACFCGLPDVLRGLSNLARSEGRHWLGYLRARRREAYYAVGVPTKGLPVAEWLKLGPQFPLTGHEQFEIGLLSLWFRWQQEQDACEWRDVYEAFAGMYGR